MDKQEGFNRLIKNLHLFQKMSPRDNSEDLVTLIRKYKNFIQQNPSFIDSVGIDLIVVNLTTSYGWDLRNFVIHSL